MSTAGRPDAPRRRGQPRAAMGTRSARRTRVVSCPGRPFEPAQPEGRPGGARWLVSERGATGAQATVARAGQAGTEVPGSAR
eukprot:13210033-Alexandrium_andersonii.AAC.1